jgi:hypothetical protein
MAVENSAVGKDKGATSKKYRYQQAAGLTQFKKMIAHIKEQEGKQGTAQTDSTQATEIGTHVHLLFDVAGEEIVRTIFSDTKWHEG